jgi:hypothetical protein
MHSMRSGIIAIAIIFAAGGCSRTFKTMNQSTEHDPWVIRTDFSNDDEWSRVRELVAAPQTDAGMKFYAYVRYVDDGKYQGKEPRDIVLALPDRYPAKFCFLIDRQCIANPEHPILVVGFYPSDRKSFSRLPRNTPTGDIATFRALPSQIQGIENNLSVANMDFEDFADSIGEDGIFRGFSR